METYSPTRDEFLAGSAHNFVLPFEMTPSAPFEVLATNVGVASGSNVTHEWAGLSAGAGHEWYVAVDDGVDVVESPAWRFWTVPEEGCFMGTLFSQ